VLREPVTRKIEYCPSSYLAMESRGVKWIDGIGMDCFELFPKNLFTTTFEYIILNGYFKNAFSCSCCLPGGFVHEIIMQLKKIKVFEIAWFFNCMLGVLDPPGCGLLLHRCLVFCYWFRHRMVQSSQ
jgi:predicted metal-binding protein